MKPWPKRLVLWLGLALCVYALWQAHGQLDDGIGRIGPGHWAMIVTLLACSWWLAVAAWRQYLAAFVPRPAEWRTAMRQIGLLLVGKYVPTGVFGFVARLYDQPDASRVRLLWAGLAEQGIGVAMPIALGGLLFFSARSGNLAWMALALLLPLLAVSGVWALHRFVDLLPWLHRHAADASPLAWPRLFLASLLQLALLAAWVAIVVVLSHVLFGLDVYAASGVAGAFWLAVAAGMLVVFSPGGIGVREAALMALAAPWLGTAQALFLAALLRIFSTMLDMAAGAVAVLLKDAGPVRPTDIRGGKGMKWLGKWLPLLRFRGSADYWRHRYRLGGDSGDGSGGAAAAYKAGVLNQFVREHAVRDVVEFGCGDGRQLELAEYPDYLGLDISPEAIRQCRARFEGDPHKRFALTKDYLGEAYDLALSLDVLFHLVEDDVYQAYLDRLFNAGRCYVVVYATSREGVRRTLSHVRHRPVEQDIQARFPGFMRMTEAEAALPPPVEHGEGGFTRFFFYRRSTGEAVVDTPLPE